jgi:hypothetical protein
MGVVATVSAVSEKSARSEIRTGSASLHTTSPDVEDVSMTRWNQGAAPRGDKRWRGPVALATLLCSLGAAEADVFEFKDHDGFEKCMSTDHLVETVNTAKGAQARMLSSVEIQLRCIEKSVTLVRGKKDKDLALEFIKTTKRLSAQENALELVGVLAEVSLPGCNEMAGYTVLTRALSFPRASSTLYARAKVVIKRCLRDKDFKKDFAEEIDSGDDNVAANSCQILLEEKLVKACKKARASK